MIFIHTALLCEAQIFIEKYKLQTIQKKRLYQNNEILLYISGMGTEATSSIQNYFEHNTFDKAINIGIAGTNDISLQIGTLAVCTKQKTSLLYIPLTTVNQAQTQNNSDKTMLYDMEGKSFFKIANKYLNEKDIYIFKVVSDHLNDTIPQKDTIKNIIGKNFDIIDQYIR